MEQLIINANCHNNFNKKITCALKFNNHIDHLYHGVLTLTAKPLDHQRQKGYKRWKQKSRLWQSMSRMP